MHVADPRRCVSGLTTAKHGGGYRTAQTAEDASGLERRLPVWLTLARWSVATSADMSLEMRKQLMAAGSGPGLGGALETGGDSEGHGVAWCF
jgi:hypothetical protein